MQPFHRTPSVPLLAFAAVCLSFFAPSLHSAKIKERSFTADEVFDYGKRILFQDNFGTGRFGRWKFSENASYNIESPHADRLAIVDAPGLGPGRKAARFVVLRAPNSFRSEVALPHETGSQERWYGERIFIPEDWVIDDDKGDDIVMQWHAIPGNWRSTFPNLAISISGEKWWIKQNYGAAQTEPTRTTSALTDPVRPGAWVSFVVHAKWSAEKDGFLKIWKDGVLVHDVKGPNIYTTIGVVYSPYFKTGIYHPTWNLKTPERQAAFAQSGGRASRKIIYATDIKIGGENARYEDIAPAPLKSSDAPAK
ncbi:MAG: heparin lyase I family protein [Opitutaceae bacterium]|nr:heparin lyase I family protein [Opitutaceae bacterium]